MLGVAKGPRIPGCGPGSDISRDGPQYFVKNTEGGAKYQVGFLEVLLPIRSSKAM